MANVSATGRADALSRRRGLWGRLRSALGGGPAVASGETLVRTSRLPRTPDETRVAGVLARLPARSRAALVRALADELRRSDGDPLPDEAELGVWRLALYERAAEELVESLWGHYLVEARRP